LINIFVSAVIDIRDEREKRLRRAAGLDDRRPAIFVLGLEGVLIDEFIGLLTPYDTNDNGNDKEISCTYIS